MPPAGDRTEPDGRAEMDAKRAGGYVARAVAGTAPAADAKGRDLDR